MPEPKKLLRKHRAEIQRLAALHGAKNVRIFGSTARGDEDAASDIDLVVDLEPDRGLLDLGGLLMDLRDLLQMPVDVVTPSILKERIRRRVMKEAVPL